MKFIYNACIFQRGRKRISYELIKLNKNFTKEILKIINLILLIPKKNFKLYNSVHLYNFKISFHVIKMSISI